MTRVRLLIALLALAWIIPLERADGEGRYNKAAFEKTMEETNKQTRRLLGALVGGDWGMTTSSAKSIADNAAKMRELTPRVAVDRINEFQAYADSLNSHAIRLAGAAKEKDAARASVLLGRIVTDCVSCHDTFRK